MTKEDVIALIGQPHSCRSDMGEESDVTYSIEDCYYGEKEAPGHAAIYFRNGKVLGTAYELGKIPN
ncbi:hypothetical protein D3C72_2382470 [compost metagenome]